MKNVGRIDGSAEHSESVCKNSGRQRPAQVIDLIPNTSEKTPGGRRNLIDPTKAVAAARKR